MTSQVCDCGIAPGESAPRGRMHARSCPLRRVSAKARIYSVEYCCGNHGLWSRDWFATRGEAAARRRQLIKELGVPVSQMEMDGSYGDVEHVYGRTIELTPAGALDFANRFATAGDPS